MKNKRGERSCKATLPIAIRPKKKDGGRAQRNYQIQQIAQKMLNNRKMEQSRKHLLNQIIIIIIIRLLLLVIIIIQTKQMHH